MKTKHANTATMSEAEVYITLREVPQIGEEAAKSMARTITLKSEVATKTDVAELRSEIKVEIAQMENKLLRWFAVSITVLGWGVMIAAMSLMVR